MVLLAKIRLSQNFPCLPAHAASAVVWDYARQIGGQAIWAATGFLIAQIAFVCLSGNLLVNPCSLRLDWLQHTSTMRLRHPCPFCCPQSRAAALAQRLSATAEASASRREHACTRSTAACHSP